MATGMSASKATNVAEYFILKAGEVERGTVSLYTSRDALTSEKKMVCWSSTSLSLSSTTVPSRSEDKNRAQSGVHI